MGGAIAEGLSWQWIFWLNVPLGIALVPLAAWLLDETDGPDASLDLPGLGLASTGLFALVAWEARTPVPMLPLRFFHSRAFSAANAVSMLMSFGMFGAIFRVAQFFQVVQGYSPFEAGLRTLPWTAMPIVVAPIAGVLSDRVGSRPLLVAGMAMMAVGLGSVAAIAMPTVESLLLVPAFVLAGSGMSLFFAPTANLVLSAVRPDEEGRASGANNTIREIGGVFGVAMLASVFSANGSDASPRAFVDGMVPVVWVGAGAGAVALASVAALAIPGRRLLAGMHLSEVPAMPELRVSRPSRSAFVPTTDRPLRGRFDAGARIRVPNGGSVLWGCVVSTGLGCLGARAEVPSGLVKQAAKRSNCQQAACSRPRRLGGKVSMEAASPSRAVEVSLSEGATPQRSRTREPSPI